VRDDGLPSENKIYQRSIRASPLRQSEVVSDLVEVRLAPMTLSLQQKPRVDLRRHPFAIVVSQDCDLEQDHRVRNPRRGIEPSEDKKLLSILFCELVDADTFVSRAAMGSKDWKTVQQNKNERYQFLESVPSHCDAAKTGIKEMVIDFKRYFTIPTDQVYSQLRSVAWHKHVGLSHVNPRMNKGQRRCTMFSPYLEQVSTRFCYFQSRVALPADHQSEP